MSVLIKNIEMPKNCSDCVFEASPRGAHYCQIEMRAVESLGRPGWCPLEEVKHGRWIEDEYGIPHCSECKAINNTVFRNYCPNCGTDMREVEECD